MTARRIIPALLAIGLLTASCASGQATEGKDLAAAQTAVATAVQGVHSAYVAGLISKANVQAADKLADRADDISKAARAAYAAGDATTAQGAITQLATLASQIVALEH